ncbi:MAG: 2-oxoacid:acceptor oxidoreductase family protein [Planctomycetota bacterium]
MNKTLTNVVIAGVGGQGVLKASDILAEAAFHAHLDVKKAELHGMSQRGGSVSSDVRFGSKVLSPMVPEREADYLVVLDETQIEVNQHRLGDDGVLISPEFINVNDLPLKKCLNIALLGTLSTFLDLDDSHLHIAIKNNLPARFHQQNMEAFALGQQSA